MNGGFGAAMRAGFGSPDGDGDPSIPASSSLYFDGSAPRGDFVAPAGSRKVLVRHDPPATSVVVTHPDVLLASTKLSVSYAGNSTLSPEATRRVSARATADGTFVVFISAGSVAGDGPLLIIFDIL